MNNTKFYKALFAGTMKSNKYGKIVYEVGKEYQLENDKPLQINGNGFQYTNYAALTSIWSSDEPYNVYEVEPMGDVLEDASEHRYCTNRIKIVKQLTEKETYLLIDKELDILVHDMNRNVRCDVARNGRDKDLDILVHDVDPVVRCEVANMKRSKDLDRLVRDNDWTVRYVVATRGRFCDLNILVSDSDWHVRVAVAKHKRNCDLEKLINDSDARVRRTVNRVHI